MSRGLNLIAGCTLNLAVSVAGRGQDTPSLGDLARQAQKDKADKPAAKVITDDDLPSNSGGGSSTLGAAPGRATQPGTKQTRRCYGTRGRPRTDGIDAGSARFPGPRDSNYQGA